MPEEISQQPVSGGGTEEAVARFTLNDKAALSLKYPRNTKRKGEQDRLLKPIQNQKWGELFRRRNSSRLEKSAPFNHMENLIFCLIEVENKLLHHWKFNWNLVVSCCFAHIVFKW